MTLSTVSHLEREAWRDLYPQLRKRSVLTEVFVSGEGVRFGQGWEEGTRTSGNLTRRRIRAPEPPELRVPPDPGEMANRAEHLWNELSEILPSFSPPLAIRLTLGRVEEEGQAADRTTREVREVGSLQAFLGENPLLPRWTRTIPWGGVAPGWPKGWTSALVREIEGWNRKIPPVELDLQRTSRVVVDVFALADLLRSEAYRWATPEFPRPSVVMPRGLEVVDPGSPFPLVGSGSIKPKGGEWEVTVVHDGVLEPASTAGAGGINGESWRSTRKEGWLQLRLTGDPGIWFPDLGREAWVLTRAWPQGEVVLGAGIRLRKGEVVGYWGPVPLPPPAWWLRRIETLLGPPVPDGTGFPVVVPAAGVRTSK